MLRRVRFERKNLTEHGEVHEKSACALFEISSQGEWEQVSPLVFEILARGESVDLLYASPSVEHEMQVTQERYPNQLRTKRLELLTDGRAIAILNWSSAPFVFLCRYDFYPELLLLKKERKLILLNATLKNKSFLSSLCLYRPLIKLFDLVVWSSALDAQRAREIGLANHPNQMIGDLRPLTILERQKNATQHLTDLGLLELKDIFERMNRDQNILLGSAWESDFVYLSTSVAFNQLLRAGSLRLWIAPHQLGAGAAKYWGELMQEHIGEDVRVAIIDPTGPGLDRQEIEQAQIIINLTPRILCESYVYFDKVIVGGGFERSAHSISEPYYSGAFIGVGPRTHRSTEYDEVLSVEPGKIVRFDTLADLQHFLARRLPKSISPCQDRGEKLIKLRNELCSLAMSTPRS